MAAGVLGNKGDHYEWPQFGELDTRRALGPDADDFALHYLTELHDGWVACTDTAAERGFGLVFDNAVFPVVWLWLVYGGWRGYYHAIMEPWTGYPSPLVEAVAAGRARTLAPGQALETDIAAIVYGGVESVSRLAATRMSSTSSRPRRAPVASAAARRRASTAGTTVDEEFGGANGTLACRLLS